MLEAALEYAAASWPVFPCRPRGKEPLTARGYLKATTEDDRIREWWRRTPRANIGHCPGAFGLLVIDIDGAEGEAAAMKLGLFAEPTLVALTPRGRHLYFHHPYGYASREIGNRKLAGVLDVRADRGYVLLPPSIHPSGHRYRWLGKASEIRELPPRALYALQQLERPIRPVSTAAPPIEADTPRRRAYVAAAIDAECLAIVHARRPSIGPNGKEPGDRNNALNRAAFSLARFIDTGEVDAGALVDMLTMAARRAGLEDRAIAKTIASAFSARGVTVG